MSVYLLMAISVKKMVLVASFCCQFYQRRDVAQIYGRVIRKLLVVEY